MTPARATLIGFSAILVWSTLALFTAMSGRIPPFQLVAITFVMGGGLIIAHTAFQGRISQIWPTPASAVLGVLGPFGDMVLYFAALKYSPPAEANIIHYLWPLLIVLFAALLPGARLNLRHVAGALLGLSATALIVLGRSSAGAAGGALLGYGFAIAGAVLWAAFSVLSRRFAAVPSESTGVTLVLCGVLGAVCHLAFETMIWPTPEEWLGVIGLGLGSTGVAYVLWDIGMKKGDVGFLGVASYAAPVLSTLVLIGFGYAPASWLIAVSCALIVLGAVVASYDQIASLIRRQRVSRTQV